MSFPSLLEYWAPCFSNTFFLICSSWRSRLGNELLLVILESSWAWGPTVRLRSVFFFQISSPRAAPELAVNDDSRLVETTHPTSLPGTNTHICSSSSSSVPLKCPQAGRQARSSQGGTVIFGRRWQESGWFISALHGNTLILPIRHVRNSSHLQETTCLIHQNREHPSELSCF